MKHLQSSFAFLTIIVAFPLIGSIATEVLPISQQALAAPPNGCQPGKTGFHNSDKNCFHHGP